MSQILSRRQSLKLGLAAATTPFIANTVWAAKPPVLVELFTSQGCSSCPPADRVLGEIKSNPNVYAVSLNVDYWDYLGWRDTLAKPEYTARQRAYASGRGDGQVYTPQVVVNGVAHVVGSQRNTVEEAIAAAQAASVATDISVDGSNLVIALGDGPATAATLWLMSIESDVKQVIERGENSGESITYHNVARKLATAGTWNGEAKTYRLKLSDIKSKNASSLLAVLQTGEVGQVLGLSRHTLSS